MDDTGAVWTRLLTWLEHKHGMNTKDILVTLRNVPGAGRGLFAIQDLPPQTDLFTLPVTALVNTDTLHDVYASWTNPRSQGSDCLTATQLISMHLSNHRPTSAPSSDPKFGPFIDSLPSDFNGHPLTWQESSDTTMRILHEHAPPSIKDLVESMQESFETDFKAVKMTLVRLREEGRRDRLTSEAQYRLDFLWGWLNVNTRCLYHPVFIERASPHNLTLAPILDFANHKNDIDKACASVPIPTFSSPEVHLSAGDEVFLRYGSHPNYTLFVEYGFVDRSEAGQIRVDDFVKGLFVGERGQWMMQVLTEEGYWGDWTLHALPAPAHPSYRLLPPLRLLHLHLPAYDDTAWDHPSFRKWQEMLAGNVPIVSAENEAGVRDSLESICLAIVDRGTKGLKELQLAARTIDKYGWAKNAIDCLEYLWQEELYVASQTLDSVRKAEEF